MNNNFIIIVAIVLILIFIVFFCDHKFSGYNSDHRPIPGDYLITTGSLPGGYTLEDPTYNLTSGSEKRGRGTISDELYLECSSSCLEFAARAGNTASEAKRKCDTYCQTELLI